MAEAVVDVLEAIQIEEQNGELVVGAPFALGDGDPQPIHEERPVGQVGEGVVHGVVQQLLLGHLAGVDVGQGARHPAGLAVGAAHRDAAAQHPAIAAVPMPHPMLVLEVEATAGQMVADLLLQPRQLVRVHAAEPLLGEDRQLVLVVADHLLPACRVVDPVLLQVPVPQPVVGAADRQRVALLADPQRLLVVLALDGIADRPVEQRRVDVILDQIILRPLAHRPQRELQVVVAGHDHDRYVARPHVGALEGLDAARIRQREIEQNDAEALPVEALETGLQTVAVSRPVLGGGGLRQIDVDQPGVPRAVLDQQDTDRFGTHQSWLSDGSSTSTPDASAATSEPRSGSVKRKVEPCPGCDSTQIRPPCRSTIR
jgi:hypothetical protein